MTEHDRQTFIMSLVLLVVMVLVSVWGWGSESTSISTVIPSPAGPTPTATFIPTPTDPSPLDGTHWRLLTIKGKNHNTNPPRATISFLNWQFYGTYVCGEYWSQGYALQGQRFILTEPVIILGVGCWIDEFNEEYFRILYEVHYVAVAGQQLHFLDEDQNGLLVFKQTTGE